jgi:hypothetical protein
MIVLVQAAPAAPLWAGDSDAEGRLGAAAQGALRSTEAFGPWPEGAWTILLHVEVGDFERLTGAPPQRAAAWVGGTLHLRPWPQLQRRDLGAMLRHEMTHHRLAAAGLRPWEEEARCLWAEGHTRPPDPWPQAPPAETQDRLDLALRRGTNLSQAWAYSALRAWLRGDPLPAPPPKGKREDGWMPDPDEVRVLWPAARVPRRLVVDGHPFAWSLGAVPHHFEGAVRFAPGPVKGLPGPVDLLPTPRGWTISWRVSRAGWVAAATAGELGADAPFEARRALAAVLARWLDDPRHRHRDGTLCPLTHCAVVRGPGDAEATQAAQAAETAPALRIPSGYAFFTGSTGGQRLSPREVWGIGPSDPHPSALAQGDRWASWTRTLTPSQVETLKRAVRPGLKPGQKGLRLGPSGPYAIESLRIACGRRFGWTLWPSNAVDAEFRADGSLHLEGHGWGHNAGLDLALALDEARQGRRAEEILREAFGADALD